jgi:hypothetical protein
MIQRIQTLYLFLAFVTGILPFYSAMEHERWKRIFFMQNQFYIILWVCHDVKLSVLKKNNLSWAD